MISTLPYRLENTWTFGGTVAYLRIYAEDSFMSGGQIRQRGDIVVTDATKGVVLKSANGTCYRLTVANGGAFGTASVTCP